MILYKHPVSGLVPWPDALLPKNYNGSRVPCDMIIGPCCCGAWHYEGEFDFEIREFPANASRELRVLVCGETSVLFEEANQRFREYLKLYTLPDAKTTANMSEGLMVEFMENLIESIRQSAARHQRFCRVPLPRGFGYKTALTEWLQTGGYQTDWTELEVTILW